MQPLKRSVNSVQTIGVRVLKLQDHAVFLNPYIISGQSKHIIGLKGECGFVLN